MKKYILANWKSNKNLSGVEVWLDKFFQLYKPVPEVEVIVAPPSLFLAPILNKLAKCDFPLRLAAQDVSPFPLGSYTGEIAADMLRGVAAYAILGHSERRRYFHETNQTVANKVSEVSTAGLIPIVCVDQPYARAQLSALEEKDLDNLLIGYGPVEAIGIDVPQSPKKIKAAVGEIKAIAPKNSVLYGGSINKDNAGECLGIEGVAGLMVGSASLDPEHFALICKIATTG